MKKLAVFLLTGLACATLLFGCGKENDILETTTQAESSVVAEAAEVSTVETEVSTEESSAEIEETTQEEVSAISSFEDFVAEQIGTGIGLFVWNETTGVQERVEESGDKTTKFPMHPDDRYFVTCRGEDGSYVGSIRLEDGSLVHPEENLDYVELSVDTTAASLQRVGILTILADGSQSTHIYFLQPEAE